MNELERIATYLELKGGFYIVKKDNYHVPYITLSTRKKEIIRWMDSVFSQYDFNYDVIDRPTFTTIRVRHKKNTKIFIKLIDKHIKFKPEGYEKVKLWSK